MAKNDPDIISDLKNKFGENIILHQQLTIDEIPTIWLGRDGLIQVLVYLKNEVSLPYKMLYDLTCIDERTRTKRDGQPQSDFTVVYQLTSFERNGDLRIKVALNDSDTNIPSITSVWESANWYEREVYDMFGMNFTGHPRLTRILMPKSWNGHPLRKEHHARATDWIRLCSQMHCAIRRRPI